MLTNNHHSNLFLVYATVDFKIIVYIQKAHGAMARRFPGMNGFTHLCLKFTTRKCNLEALTLLTT